MSLHEPGISHKKELLRGIGFAGAAVLVLNSVIGAGIFALPGVIAARAGILSPWLFLAIGVLIITVVLTFAELSSYFKDSGGPVLFTTSAFGPLVGFSTGWILFVSRMTAFAANTNAMAVYLAVVWPWFGSGIGRGLLIFTVCSTLTWANFIGVKEGVRTMVVITFLKIVPILILILLGLQHVSADTLFPATMPTIDDLGGTTLLLIYAFVGFESATIISGETKKPKETLPKALVQMIMIIGVLYFLIVLVYISVLPDAGASEATLTEVGRELMGPAGAIMITFAAFFSIGGNLSSIMLAVPRLPFALAEERLLPRWFGHVHEKYSTPSNSILLLGGLGLIFALSGSFAALAAASSLTRLISFILCIGSLPIIRKKATEEEKNEAYRLKGGYVIPVIALALCLWIGAQSTIQAWQVTGMMLAAGLVLYSLAAKRRARWANSDSG
ncbi:MAG: APC family permease [Gammaproteobacteria bacterium]|nr:APC family permease [Gammaproteobacteria bacterium]